MVDSERVNGFLLAVGAGLITVGFGVHPPGEGISVTHTMELATHDPILWRGAHTLIAFGALTLAVAGLLILTTHSPLSEDPPAAVGWGLVVLFTIPFAFGLILEASVVVDLVLAGETAQFQTWYGGLVLGLAAVSWPLFFGLALVGASDYRTGTAPVPRWASAFGSVGWAVAILYFVGLGFRIPELWVAQYAAAAGLLWLLVVGIRRARGN